MEFVQATKKSMEQLGFYAGGCHYEEEYPAYVGMASKDGDPVIVVAAYDDYERGVAFAEVYPLRSPWETWESFVTDPMPQDMNPLQRAIDDVVAWLAR